jgi:hypothetical protein
MPYPRLHPIGACLASGLSITLAIAPASVPADIVDEAFQPRSVLVSDPASPVVDFEPEPGDYQFAWVDSQENLWVGKVDPVTGGLMPPDGRGTLIDTQAALPREFLNGPEWSVTHAGPVVVYTRKTAVGPRLVKAYFDGGDWVVKTLGSGMYRYGPRGSLDQGDSQPRIFYKGPSDFAFPDDPAEAFYWRNLNEPASETKIGERISPTRWVPGYRQIPYTAVPGGGAGGIEPQVYLYDADSNQAIQITTSPGGRASPWVWTGPDFGNQRLMTVTRNRDVLEVYLETMGAGNGEPQWTLLRELRVPLQAIGPYIYNARPFVYDGESYIVMLAMECRSTCDGKYVRRGGLTDVWLVGSLSGEPLWRRISADVPAFREDPETLEIQGVPFVYIYRFNAQDESPDGIYKLATGLQAGE